MKKFFAFLAAGILCTAASSVHAAKSLNVGDKAPAFSTLDDQGKEWSSEDVAGKHHLVVYFYPAAMTGGCTKQACAFRDDKPKWTKLNAVVVGVSGDNPEGLAHFKKAENLNFTLLADEKGEVAKKFGVPAGKGGSIKRAVDGKEVTLKRGVTTKRWTFVISKDGKVVYKGDRGPMGTRPDEVKAAITKLLAK